MKDPRSRIERSILPAPPRWNPKRAFAEARQEVFTARDGSTWIGYVMQEANDPRWVKPPPPQLGPWKMPPPCYVCSKPIGYREAHWLESRKTNAPPDWEPECWHLYCNHHGGRRVDGPGLPSRSKLKRSSEE